jgi:nucleoside 2-deoxyribosyltransferase
MPILPVLSRKWSTPDCLEDSMKDRRLRVYLAGPFTADNVLGVLDNMREGMRLGTEMLLLGFAPFVPWHDYHFQLMLREGEYLRKKDYYNNSLAWLEVSDVVLVREGWENSEGTLNEIAYADSLELPVFYTVKALLQWAEEEGWML